ncbi:MAG: hypothetical protein NZ455_11025 [Bacteroidia bacterium]|nr:hypothetical protein [Bacteroidia bacterium]MDW8347017.1 hypothetical protein [Bacteroidia bacterium]
MRSASVAPSVSVVRSSPTRAQRGTRPKVKLFFRLNLITIVCFFVKPKQIGFII